MLENSEVATLTDLVLDEGFSELLFLMLPRVSVVTSAAHVPQSVSKPDFFNRRKPHAHSCD